MPPKVKKVKKDKGFKAAKGAAEGFVLPCKKGLTFLKFLQVMGSDPNLGIIRREVVPAERGKRKTNSFSLQYALEQCFETHTLKCRSDSICLLHVFESKITDSTLRKALAALDPIVNGLFFAPDSDAAFRQKVRRAILAKPWGSEALLNEIKKSGIFALSRSKKAMCGMTVSTG